MENKLAPFVDKRNSKRKRAKFTLRYRISGSEDSAVSVANTVDVSSESISFFSTDAIAIGSRLDAEIIIPTMLAPLQFKGNIKRIEQLEKSRFLYALTFDEMSKADRDFLEKYVQTIDIDSILGLAVKRDASDVHLVANQPPVLRIEGDIAPIEAAPISARELRKMILSIMTERQKATFEQNLELDFSYLIPEGVRFRVNVHLEKGNLEAAFRVILEEIRSISKLGLPSILEPLARKKRGLIIVTGPAGSGKSTTMAAMIDLINRERKCMVISIEDPIEYVHKSKSSIIKQREVGADTLSFANALKHVLRQDPNVIFVGEMRDLDSISMAITAAETGHLVLTTLHTPDTVECINRIIDVYPGPQQAQVRSQLATSLEAIIAQLLLPRKDGEGRIVATEVLIVTTAIKNLIRSKKLEQIYSYIEAGEKYGMHTMDSSLLRLFENEAIDIELAKGFIKNPAKLREYR